MKTASNYQNLAEVQQAINEGKVTSKQITREFLEQISVNNERLNIFNEVFSDEAVKKAEEVDKKMQEGNAGKLAGLVIGLKDNICYKAHHVEASSKILEDFESLFSATVVNRLLDEDAVIIGRLNCDEFAMGSSNENSAFGPVRNPLDEERVPGGSSGGSAAAVATGMCHATLGSDTGGSIRQPAAFCGTVGMKPSYGRVSRYGLIAFGSSFDQIGPLTRNVEDAALILEVIAGRDDHDGTVSTKEVPAYSSYLKEEYKTPWKIAYLEDCINSDSLDGEIKEGIQSLLSHLENKGITENQKAALAYLDQMIPIYQVLSNAEASSNLARYDGILYGYRSPEAETLEETIVKSRTEGFGEEVKRRIMLGTFVLSEGYYDAYYSKAQKIRKLVKESLEEQLKENDFIMLPATPGTAFKFGEKSDLTSMYWEDVFTIPASLAGLPAITLPIGKDNNGMPFSIQIIGRNFEEEKLLAFAKALSSTINQ